MSSKILRERKIGSPMSVLIKRNSEMGLQSNLAELTGTVLSRSIGEEESVGKMALQSDSNRIVNK
jgi:hypothetical protein